MGAVQPKSPKVPDNHRTCRATAVEIAGLIRQTREDCGLTQYELAARMNSTQSTVARWETGDHDFNIKTLTRIAEALEVELTIRFGPTGASA